MMFKSSFNRLILKQIRSLLKFVEEEKQAGDLLLKLQGIESRANAEDYIRVKYQTIALEMLCFHNRSTRKPRLIFKSSKRFDHIRVDLALEDSNQVLFSIAGSSEEQAYEEMFHAFSLNGIMYYINKYREKSQGMSGHASPAGMYGIINCLTKEDYEYEIRRNNYLI